MKREARLDKANTRKTTKNKGASKKKTLINPVKVVYISTPMKIKTSASNFRALVQELTGRDSDFPPNPTKLPEEEEEDDEFFSTAQIKGAANDDHLQVVSSESTTCSSPSNTTDNIDDDDDDDHNINNNKKKKNVFEMFDEDDDVFMPQMMEGFSGIFPSAMWYESTHQAV